MDLFTLRNRVAPGVPIFGHCYDFPIPNGAHPPCVGPWLKPSLDFRNWSTGQGVTIAREALTAFRNLLKRLENETSNNFHVVDTQGVLSAADWADEPHSGPEGFRKVAQMFATALGREFQAQISNTEPTASATG